MGFSEMNRGSCQGFRDLFMYFAGLAYSYTCCGKGWVRDFDWILLALCCLVRLCKNLALVGPCKPWTWSWLPYHISLFVWMLALALIQFCSHISLFWNLVCYGWILVIRLGSFCRSIWIFIVSCQVSIIWIQCYFSVFTSWRVSVTYSAVLAHGFSMMHIPIKSCCSFIMWVSALMLNQQGSDRGLGFTHMLFKPCLVCNL